jgi:hypothetical protein
MVGWFGKYLEGNGRDVMQVLSQSLPGGKLRKTSVRIGGVPAEIRTESLLQSVFTTLSYFRFLLVYSVRSISDGTSQFEYATVSYVENII